MGIRSCAETTRKMAFLQNNQWFEVDRKGGLVRRRMAL